MSLDSELLLELPIVLKPKNADVSVEVSASYVLAIWGHSNTPYCVDHLLAHWRLFWVHVYQLACLCPVDWVRFQLVKVVLLLANAADTSVTAANLVRSIVLVVFLDKNYIGKVFTV